MSYRRLAEALLQSQPYFGPALRSLQGLPERHKYILPIVKALAKSTCIEILEIGTWAGASAVSWALALKKLGASGHVTCVDAWLPYFDLEKERGGHYERMQRAAEDGIIYKLFRHNVSCSGFSGIIVPRAGMTRDVLPMLASRSFQIVYLDGSHSLEDVVFDIREAKRLIRLGGIICGDDLEMQLKDLDPLEVETIALSGQDFVPPCSGRTGYHPGVTLAVAREFGEVSAWNGFWAVRFSGEGWCQVTLDLADAEVPEHAAEADVTIEADTPGHHLISNQGRHFALAKLLGPPHIVAEVLSDQDLPPLVFAGSSLQEVQEKIQLHNEARAAGPPVNPGLDFYLSPQLLDSHRGFNLVRFKSNVYGLRQSIGEVDLASGDAAIGARYSPQDAIVGNSMGEVIARIDAVEAERTVQELTARLKELEENADSSSVRPVPSTPEVVGG